MDTVRLSLGKKLTLGNDGKILIGAGVSQVRISGQIYFYRGNYGAVKYFQINRNNNRLIRMQSYVAQQYICIPCTPKVIDVSQGDKISMEVSGTADDVFKASHYSSYLEVEVID